MSNNMPPERTGVSNGKDAPREIFKKPHLEPPQIIEKLQKQGMIVDPRTALPYLQTVGAYRMNVEERLKLTHCFHGILTHPVFA